MGTSASLWFEAADGGGKEERRKAFEALGLTENAFEEADANGKEQR
jgi:hypothetical protein